MASRIQIQLGPTVLYDTAWLPGVEIQNMGGKGWEWMLDVVQPIRAKEVQIIPRELASTELVFMVAKQHADHGAALVWLLTSPAAIVRGGIVQIVATSPGVDPVIFYLSQGALRSVSSPRITGSRTELTYSLVGGRWLLDGTAEAVAALPGLSDQTLHFLYDENGDPLTA